MLIWFYKILNDEDPSYPFRNLDDFKQHQSQNSVRKTNLNIQPYELQLIMTGTFSQQQICGMTCQLKCIMPLHFIP